jgi:ATP-dependent RNA helicase DDX55/SPB4
VKKKKWLKGQQRSASIVTSENKSLEVAVMDMSDENDWDDLAKEERMVKKLRRGKISQQEFDTAFADL